MNKPDSLPGNHANLPPGKPSPASKLENEQEAAQTPCHCSEPEVETRVRLAAARVPRARPAAGEAPKLQKARASADLWLRRDLVWAESWQPCEAPATMATPQT